jgi:hypothetical protein
MDDPVDLIRELREEVKLLKDIQRHIGLTPNPGIYVEIPEPNKNGMCNSRCKMLRQLLMGFETCLDERSVPQTAVFIKPGPRCPRSPEYQGGGG